MMRRRMQGLLWFGLLMAVPGAVLAEQRVSLVEQRLLRVLERDRALFQELERRSEDPEGAERDNSQRAQRIASDYERLMTDFPDSTEVLVAYARFLQKTEHPKEAAALFHKALTLDPDIPVANQQLATWHALAGEPAKALPLYLRAIAGAPNEPAYHFDLGSVLAAERDRLIADGVLTREALDGQMVQAFANAARLAPDSLDAAFRHAEALADVEKPDWKAVFEAWNALELRVQPESLQHDAVLIHLARAQLELGRADDARRLLSEVRRDSPLGEARGQLEARLGEK